MSASPLDDKPTASYEADPAEVKRVLLLYSGGLDTSVMLKWIQDSYEAEVVCLTVNLGQPGEDYGVIEDKARRLGALECHVVDARERFADRLRDPGDQGQRPLRRRLPAVHRARPAADRPARGRARARVGLRHDRPRLHRQGQRPGPDRGDGRDPGAGAADDRPGALLADGPRGGDRLRPRARHPGQGRHRGRALLDRRQPLGPLLGGPLDRGPRPRARGRRLPARHPPRGGARRGADGHGRVRGRACRSRSTASGSAWSSCWKRPPRSAAATGSGSSTTSRTASSASRCATSTRRRRRRSCSPPTRSSRSWSARSTRTSSSPSSTASGPTWSTPGLWWEPLRTDLDAYMEAANAQVTGDDRPAPLQRQRPRRHPLLAERRLRRRPRLLRRVGRALLAGRLARLHRALVAAVAARAPDPRATAGEE